jgi:hypothetical protein
MLKIDNKALNYVYGKKLCFVVGIQNTPLECACSNCHTTIKTLKTEVLFETEVLDKECYDIYEDQGVKVFGLKDLKIVGDMNVYVKRKIPFLQPKFGLKGVVA